MVSVQRRSIKIYILDCSWIAYVYSNVVDEVKKNQSLKIEDFPEYYQQQIRSQLETCHRNSGTTANRKSSTTVAKELPLEIHESKRFAKAVRVHFHSIRHRLPDLDNIQGKSVLDAIVKAGVLPDDRPEWIPERPTHTAEIGKEEKTIITIEAINEE